MAKQTISLEVPAHRALVAAAALGSGIREKRVTMSSALIGMTELTRRHLEEFGEILAAMETEAG